MGVFVLTVVGGLLALQVMLAPAPLVYYPRVVLNLCLDESPANIAFVRDLVAGERTDTRVKRAVYLQGLWSMAPTADNTYVGGTCAGGQNYRVFGQDTEPKAENEGEDPSAPYADYTVEITYFISERVAPKTADGFPITQAHIFPVRDATVPKRFWENQLPAELWAGPAVVTLQVTRIEKRVRVDIVISPPADDAGMLARVNCTERKLAYADWREPFACLLPREVLEHCRIEPFKPALPPAKNVALDSFRDLAKYRNMSGVFKALSDPTRRQVLQLLRRGPMSAGEIAEHFDVAKSTMSAHFAILREADLVASEKDGKSVVYHLNLSVLEEALMGFAQTFGFGDERKRAGALKARKA
jgi:DNA-binding transcriptional ArsR family regulator